MSKDNCRLGRLGVLAPAALSACIDASVLAVPAAGAIVSTVLKELSKAFMLKKWFHGNITAKEAEHLMMEKGKNGSFLVRESRGHPGDFVLSVRVRGRVSHVMIKKQNNKYDVGSGEQFEDLVGLIEHFRAYPMTESSGDVLRLLQPISTSLKNTTDQNKTEEMMESDYTSDDSYKCGLDSMIYSLQSMEIKKHFTTAEATKPENIDKNRYRNILPYDHTRVLLQNNDGTTAGDYINANYVLSHKQCYSICSLQSSNESLNSVHSLKVGRSHKNKPFVSKSLSDDALKEIKRRINLDKLNGNQDKAQTMYIATQGCLATTQGDFWRMIWQQDVRIIVMITKEFENGKKKCEKYWPDKGKMKSFDGLDIRLKNETLFEDYLIRELEITDINNCSKTIYQYQFTAWPDHGTPKRPTSILAFVIDINKMMNLIMQSRNKPEKNILCVHCSAGVGRTGTFIVLDMLINKINMTGIHCETDVSNTVRWVRNQRAGMVQNKSQYRFIYQAIQEYIDCYSLKTYKKVLSINI